MLENLAARMRQCGLFLTLLRSDGSLAYHDPSTEPFFLKFVLPAMQGDPGSRPPLAEPAAAMNPASPIALWSMIPGVIIAAVPHVERRAIRGIFAIAAKAHTFRQNDELLRFCERAGVDSTWLQHQADVVPSYGEESLQRQARLFLGMVRDQLRLASLEQELEMLSAQLANSYEELSLIYQLSGGMKVNRSAGDFFRQACLDVMQVMDIRAMGVVLRGDGGLDQPPAVYGSIDLPRSTLERLADHLLEFFSHRPGPLQVNQIEKDRHLSFLSAHARQLLAVPLVRGQQVLGCLFALDKNHDEFNSVDSKLLTSISNESAVYLENAMLFEDVHGLMMGLLHSLTSAVDAKDAYTCGHSERVALLSRQLALAAGLPEPEADRVYMAGLLHDVGKIGVPEAVLQKAGRLTPEEFDQIKKHPEIGARILRDIRQIEDIIPGVLHHHERYDGKGYPAGLAGEDIPRMGRIICLADCFDAMTSSRTYRKALPLEVAMTEIHRCAGTQFDPRLADAFLKLSTAELRDMLKNHSVAARTLLDLQQSIRSAA
ncbi:MAG: HD domain-containing protein [Phycisphaerales bacterium]|nr:HD domain-containing protein [Phycisphaerales bacterium]